MPNHLSCVILNPMTTPAQKPRFLLYWPSWVTLVVVGCLAFIAAFNTLRYNRLTKELETGWPFASSLCDEDGSLWNINPFGDQKEWFPVGIACNILVMFWIVAGSVYVVERISRKLNPVFSLAFIVAFVFWVSLCLHIWTRQTDYYFSNLTNGNVLLRRLDQWLDYFCDALLYFLIILPSYATVLWIGKLWDWAVKRRRDATTLEK